MANKTLTNRIAAAEMEEASAWHSIDAMYLNSDAALNDVIGLETVINDIFANSIDGLRAATGR